MSTVALEQKAVELLDRLESVATEYTPEVYSAAVSVVQVNGIADLIWGILSIGFLIGSFFIFKWIWRTCHHYEEIHEKIPESHAAFMIISGVCGVIATFAGALHIGLLFNVWNYVAIFNPELALAHEVLNL